MKKTETVVEVLDPERFLVAYKPYKAAIEELKSKYGGVIFEVHTKAGMAQAKEARREILDPVYATEKLRKQLKAPALEFSRRIDGDAKEIDVALRALAEPIDAQIKDQEAKEEAEREAKRQAELNRQREITNGIAAIREHVLDASGQSSHEISEILASLEGFEINIEKYGDRTGEAQLALDETHTRLSEMLAQAEAKEAEDARIEAERKAEAERLAAERAELERQKAEQAEIERAAREKREAEELAAAQARAAEEAKLRAEREAIEAERRESARLQVEVEARARAEQEAAQRKLDEDRAAFERQKREAEQAEQRRLAEIAEAKAQAEREKAAAERAEAERREREDFVKNGPGNVEIVQALADHYNVTLGDVMGWLQTFDWAATDEQLAAQNIIN